MGFWDRYDHPNHQPVPIDRLSAVSLFLAATSLFASPFCLGPSLAFAAVMLGHRVRARLNPYDVAGARLTRNALWMGYGVLVATVGAYVWIGVSILALSNANLIVGVFVFIVSGLVLLTFLIAFAVVEYLVRRDDQVRAR